MHVPRLVSCSICNAPALDREDWFLLVDNRWQDKLTILQWNDRLASLRGVHHVCCAAHVQELVLHWMATGSLAYPFARTAPAPHPQRRRRSDWVDTFQAEYAEIDTSRGQQIGELTVHRESMLRALDERPQCLKAILDALQGALQHDSRFPAPIPPEIHADLGELFRMYREM